MMEALSLVLYLLPRIEYLISPELKFFHVQCKLNKCLESKQQWRRRKRSSIDFRN